jgi:soluble lytic murein transglycosylase
MSAIYPKMQTSYSDRALNILFSAESGGNHFVPGTQNPVTSPKGAVGIAQVMPATGHEAAKLAGLDWDESRFRNDPDYNKALGTAYFNHQLKTFHGDLGMAYAAYNAGPGATQDAIDKARKEGGNWLSYLPNETQAYVTNNMNAYAAGEGQYQRPTLADAHAAALEHIGPNASLDLRKQVLAEVTNQYEEQTKAIKQREEEGTAEAMRQLLQNGGKFSALPVNIRAAVPPNQVDNLMNFGKKIAEGEPISTDWRLYYQLKTDPSLLRNTNLMAFRDKLNDTEFKQLTAEQQSAANDSHTETRSAKDILHGYMREAGIDPTPKDDDEKGAAVVGKIWSAFDQRISEAEQEKGKKLNAEEVQKVAAQLFTKVGVKGLLYGTNEKPAVLIDSKKDKVAVPDEDRAQIINAWRTAKPGQAITEDDIFYMYAKHKGLL